MMFMVILAMAGNCLTPDEVKAQRDFGPATRETDRAISDAATRKVTDKMRAPKKVSITVESADGYGPQTEEGQKFLVNDIRFVGMRSLSAQDLLFITRKYVKRAIDARDMKNLTREIELEYLRRGVISSVFIPSQEIDDETLTVQILEPDTR